MCLNSLAIPSFVTQIMSSNSSVVGRTGTSVIVVKNGALVLKPGRAWSSWINDENWITQNCGENPIEPAKPLVCNKFRHSPPGWHGMNWSEQPREGRQLVSQSLRCISTFPWSPFCGLESFFWETQNFFLQFFSWKYLFIVFCCRKTLPDKLDRRANKHWCTRVVTQTKVLYAFIFKQIQRSHNYAHILTEFHLFLLLLITRIYF